MLCSCKMAVAWELRVYSCMCAIADECVSLAQAFKLHRRVPGSALAVWEVGGGRHECWEAKAIVAAVEFCMYPDGKVGTILPIDFL